MADRADFWVIAYDNIARAEQVWHNVVALAGKRDSVNLADYAVLECDRNGSYTLDRQPFPQSGNVFSGSMIKFLAGLALGVPFSERGSDARLDTAWSNICKKVGIDRKFIGELKRLTKPGGSALLVINRVENLQEMFRTIRDPGGVALKTKVDLQHAHLIQSTLNEHSTTL